MIAVSRSLEMYEAKSPSVLLSSVTAVGVENGLVRFARVARNRLKSPLSRFAGKQDRQSVAGERPWWSR